MEDKNETEKTVRSRFRLDLAVATVSSSLDLLPSRALDDDAGEGTARAASRPGLLRSPAEPGRHHLRRHVSRLLDLAVRGGLRT